MRAAIREQHGTDDAYAVASGMNRTSLGLLLEMRAAKYMDGEATYSPFWDLHAVLNQMHTAELAALSDPTGLGSRFGATSSDSSHADAMSKLARAVTRSRVARDYATSDDNANAITQLKLLFNRQ